MNAFGSKLYSNTYEGFYFHLFHHFSLISLYFTLLMSKSCLAALKSGAVIKIRFSPKRKLCFTL